MKKKYPSIPYLPYSSSIAKKDSLFNLDTFLNQEVVATVKYDGENTTIAKDYIHARSLSSVDHESRHWLKSWAVEKQLVLDENIKICGENLYAVHSIKYDDLLSYFYAFSAWDIKTDVCLSWEQTKEICFNLGIPVVECFYEGIFDIGQIASAFEPYRAKHEGYVVRLKSEFSRDNFLKSIAKWVRQNHVQSDKHWMYKPVVKNSLTTG